MSSAGNTIVAPWEVRTDDSRQPDTLANFIICCEDLEIEPNYFKSFERTGKVKVNEVPNQRAGLRNVNNAITHLIAEGLMIFENGKYVRPEHVTENVWCVFDRDREHLDPGQIQPVNNVEFDNAIQIAQNMQIKVAWSNDVFELWFLLHFEDVEPGVQLHRTVIYERLANYIAAIANPSPELQRLLEGPNFRYDPLLKNKRNYLTITKPLLNGHTEAAIARAITLQAAFNPNIPYHLQNPCTMVYLLVKELIAAGN